MGIDFVPQFHKQIAQGDGRNAWVALPLPKTLIAAKTGYYLAWQREECLRLHRAGERVVVKVPGATAEAAECAASLHCRNGAASARTGLAHCAARAGA